MSRSETVNRFRISFESLIDLLRAYPPARRTRSGACGLWTPQQVVAHLNGWLLEARRRFRRFPRGTGDVVYNVDGFNDVSVWLRRDQSWQETVAELEARVQALIDHTCALREETYEREPRYAQWLDSLAEDCDQHRFQLVEFARQVEAQPLDAVR